jgi:ABC-2 type transport system permease protein
MGKLWTIIKAEYAQVVKKKSFIVGIILTPVFLLLVTVLPALLADRGVSKQVRYAVVDVDGQGIGQLFAQALTRYKLDNDSTTEAYSLSRLYSMPDASTDQVDSLRSALDTALSAGQLKYYVVIFPNVVNNDSALLVSKSINFRTSARFEARLSGILSEIRLEHSNINLPIDSVMAMTRSVDMLEASPGGKKRDFMTVYFGAFIFIMIIFMSVIGFGQILMRSVIEEKNSRIMEVLVSSVSPFQLMLGKVIGLGAANLTQIAIWVAIGIMIFSNRTALNVSANVSEIVFNPVLIVFFILFLIIAYVMYASLFAFIGSICNSDKEAQNFMFPIIISLMLPVLLLMYIIQEPDSTLSVVLSMIPVLTPTMMVARLNIAAPETFNFADPIILEAVIGVVIALAFTVLLVWVTARVFRIGILMYGKRPTLPEIIKWVRYA